MSLDYKKCKQGIINKIMKKYEKDKKKISMKQEIAIALSIAQKECQKKLTKNDIEIIENKLYNFINKKENNITFSLVKEYKILCNYYNEKKKYNKIVDIQSQFMTKIIKIQHENNLSEKIYKEIIKK